MLKRRLIPKLQLKSRQLGKHRQAVLVTTIGFDETIEIGDPVSQAKIYESQAADELIFLDLDRQPGERPHVLDIIRQAAEQIFMPITIGGGVRTVDDFRQFLLNGADKVSVCTAAIDRPELLTEAADVFGAQAVVLSIDYRREKDGTYRVYADGGKRATKWDPVAWAVEGQMRGAGEVLLTSIDRDGTRAGLDVELTRKVAEAVSIPLITSGGCGLTSHFVQGFIDGKADAVSAGTYFCFKDENPMQTRAQIRNAGIPIRLLT